MKFNDGIKVIAEVGSNWETLEHCKDSIALAKACGAEAVKFQLYDFKSLYGRDPEYHIATIDPHKMIATKNSEPEGLQGILPIDWLPALKAKADNCEIEFMCSAFSPELLDVVNPYVDTHKLASAEMTHLRMLEKLRSYDKPVIMSTGGHEDFREIKRSIEILCKDNGVPHLCVMYCVSEYPTRYVNFGDMMRYSNLGDSLGFSDHTTDVLCIGREAKNSGATVIEKHVNFVGVTDTPDAPHSLTLDEFKYFVKSIRADYDELPNKYPGENDMRMKHNRRLIATRTIEIGEILKEGENFGIYRSLKHETKALSPWKIDHVNGKNAKVKIEAGEGISLDQISI